MPRSTELAHLLIRQRLRPGDRAIDATLGNGHDALFLAQLVGEHGRVWAFDPQPAAHAAAKAEFAAQGVDQGRVTFLEMGHETMAAHLTGSVQAIMFNLGYLPGGDASIITQPTSTDRALRDAYDNLRPGGRLICVAYTGHPGGPEESDIVLKFAEQQASAGLHVEKIGYYPTPGKPWILVVNKPAA